VGISSPGNRWHAWQHALTVKPTRAFLFGASAVANCRVVADNLESCRLKALDACYHPAMRSDYFRLCYVGLRGGCYVDADDIYSGQSLDVLFGDGRLKLQPLCYDVLSDAMVPPEVFTRLGAGSQNWIFY